MASTSPSYGDVGRDRPRMELLQMLPIPVR
jgi:hypothetical protein